MKIKQFQIDGDNIGILMENDTEQKLLWRNIKTSADWVEIEIPTEYIPIDEQKPRLDSDIIKRRSLSPEKEVESDQSSA